MSLEKYNRTYKGLNDFLSSEYPYLFRVYRELSEQYGFNYIIHDDENPSDIRAISNQKIEVYYKGLLLLTMMLGHKIKILQSKETHDILSSFNALIGTNCQYSLCEDGNICFDMTDDKEFTESNESGLVITLGILACCKINLALLEKYNPSLKGLNQYLSQEFSDYYNAYTEISDQYGFYHSVSLESKLKR